MGPFAVIGLICTTVGVTIGAMFRGPSPQPERGPAVAVSSTANTENSKPATPPARAATTPVPVVTVRPVEAPRKTAATPAVTKPERTQTATAPIRSRTAGVRSTYRTPRSTVLARESAARENERPRRRLTRRDDEARETERPRRRRSFRADDAASTELATRPARRRRSLRRDDDRREEIVQETEAPRRRYSRRSRRYEEAATATETFPRRRRERTRRGRTEVEVEDIEAAYGVRSGRRASRDETPDRLNNKAYRLQRQGRHAEAEPLLRQALKRNPRSAYAQYNMGWSLLSQGKPRQALGHLRRTARQQPGRWEPQQRLAEAYERVGDREKAAEARARARELRSGRRRRSTDRSSLPTRAFPTVASAPAIRSSVGPAAWQQSTDRREEGWLRIKREGVVAATLLASQETQ
ncbi:MAG TPA: tetratricopeptide repeat protein [Armatimonadota bacterium]|nr:tetratricopeptide repeat protein [Armatimonadota bacterium]